MTLIEMIETTCTIPNRFTTMNGRTMEYMGANMESGGEFVAMYWEMKHGVKHHLWAIQYGANESEAKDKLKAFILSHGKHF